MTLRLFMKEMELQSVLHKAMKIEEYSWKFYSIMVKMVNDYESKKIFKRLAIKEKSHLSEIKVIIGNDEAPIESINFSPNKYFGKDIRKVMGEGAVTGYIFAIEMEEKTMDFYCYALVTIENADARKLILKIIKEEEAHINLLNEKLTSFLDFKLKNIHLASTKTRVQIC